MLFCLGTAGVILENDLGGFVRVFLGPFPALHGCADKPHHLVCKSGVPEVGSKDIEPVFHRRHALILILEGDQLVRVHPGINHLPVFIVGHGRDAIGLALQQWVNVKALLQNFYAGFIGPVCVQTKR